ncbi:GNAT family N-acetyltransferase [Kiloniella sp. EL199]|uniref:GNAT family N-acetyltransferase n=1 Tax=Kiloniella sp. EL199 TaxID=2107581 RepID=UPI000EA15C3D|nr:GNAT family N-acetyltransferase [Kiloniella sp. EL199]
MIIRLARETDYVAAVELYAEFGGGVPGISGEEGLAQWRALLAHPGTSVVIAADEGKDATAGEQGKGQSFLPICAIVTLHILLNMTYLGWPYALIGNVITSQRYRGQGLGRQVVERTINMAWEANAYKIMLLTGKGRKDGGAKGFYESLGFSDEDKYGMTLRKLPARK